MLEKLTHEGADANASYVDLNRAGTLLMCIGTRYFKACAKNSLFGYCFRYLPIPSSKNFENPPKVITVASLELSS